MKKKGLIISTIVMMLVVVVALSTATYAWFAVSADAKVSSLTVQTAASDGLQIAAMYKYDGSTVSASSGSMSLTTTTKYWQGETADYGAELLFESALATAYGVTGDGIAANMYTAASRTATSYLSTQVNAAYWGVGVVGGDAANNGTDTTDATLDDLDAPGAVAAMTGIKFYVNAAATTVAAGEFFYLGSYSGTIEDASANLCDKGYYIRTQGYYTTQITDDNDTDFTASNTFYSDAAGNTLANAGAFANGVWTPSGTLFADATAASLTLYVRNFVGEKVTSSNSAAYLAIPATVYYTTGTGEALAAGANFTNGVYGGATASDLEGFYAETAPTSGDIETAWTYEANNSALTNLSPRYLIPAVANSEYFSLNFALKTQRGMVANTDKTGVADIFIKKLTATASGGMAAASRIALLEYTDSAFTTFATNPIKYVFVPFSTAKYTTGTWGVDGVSTETYNIAPASKWFQSAGFAYQYAGTSDFTTDYNADAVIANGTGEVIRYDTSAISTASVWQTATFFNIDKNSDWADKDLYDTCQAGADATKKILSVGTFTAANTVKYYQLIIWFEGTDEQCFSGFAGTGVTVDLAFDFYQQWR